LFYKITNLYSILIKFFSFLSRSYYSILSNRIVDFSAHATSIFSLLPLSEVDKTDNLQDD